MKWLKNILSYSLIAAGIVFGITGIVVSEGKESIVQTAVFYVLFGACPYFLGWYILDRRLFKSEFWPRFRLLTAVTLFAPIILMSYDHFFHVKHDMVSTPTDIYLDSRAIPELLAALVVVAFTLFFLSFLSIYIVWFDIQKYVYFIPFVSLGCLIVVWYITDKDYKAVRDQGIVISRQDTYEEIGWTEVDIVYLDSYVKKVLVRGGGRADYVWAFIFRLKNGEDIVFGPFSYHEESLEKSLAIKNKVMDEKIPISIDQLTEDDWAFAEIDIKSEKEAKVEDFYALIQYDAKTGEYYYISYD